MQVISQTEIQLHGLHLQHRNSMLNKIYQYSNKNNGDNTAFRPVVSVAPDVQTAQTLEFDISSNLPNQTVLLNLVGNITSEDMSNAQITNAPVTLDSSGNGTLTYNLDPASNFSNANVTFNANVTSNAGNELAVSSNVIIGKLPALEATGGTITQEGEGNLWTIHTFTANSQFEITSISQPLETLFSQIVSPGQDGGEGLWDQFARSGTGVRRRIYNGGYGGAAGTITHSNVSVSTLSISNIDVTVGQIASNYSAFNNAYAVGSFNETLGGPETYFAFPDYGVLTFTATNTGASSTRSAGTYSNIPFQPVSGFQPGAGFEAKANVVVESDGSVSSVTLRSTGGIPFDGKDYDIGSVCALDDQQLGGDGISYNNVVLTINTVRSFDSVEYLTSNTSFPAGTGGVSVDIGNPTTYNTPTWPLTSGVGSTLPLYSMAYDQGNADLYYKTAEPNTWTDFSTVNVEPTDLIYADDLFLSDPTNSGLAIYGGNIASSGGTVSDPWFTTQYAPILVMSGTYNQLGGRGLQTTGGTGGFLYDYEIPAITVPVIDQARSHQLTAGGGGGGYEGDSSWLSAGGTHNNTGDGTDVSNGDIGIFSTSRLLTAGNGGAGVLAWDNYPGGSTTLFCHGGAGGAPDGDNRSGTVPSVTGNSGYGGDSDNDYAGYDALYYGAGGGGAGARAPDLSTETSDLSSDPYYTAGGIKPPGGSGGSGVVKIAYRSNIRGFFPT